MKKNWKYDPIKNKRTFKDLEPATENLLLKRGINTTKKLEKFLSPDYEEGMYDPFLLSGIKKAVNRFLKARQNKEKICVYGDYDADGVTSSVLLHFFLSELGVDNFCYIPDRDKEGYGLNTKAIDYIKGKEADLIITVDCGITNKEEVEYAKEKGIDVIILDHHHVPPEIPKAVAVVDPKRKQGKYPFDELAGVGVAFKFAQAVAQKTKDYEDEKLKWYLDLVAIGTVADCVPLVEENRVLVKFGLIVLSKTKNVGLKQLFKVGNININENCFPNSQQVSFQIAPRINAAGRMDHANIAYELLSRRETQIAQARELALELEAQNSHRQKVTNYITQSVEDNLAKLKKVPKVIIQSSPHWMIGVIGLAAGKLADKFNRPTILLQDTGSNCRGSGRSVEGFNLVESLERNGAWLKKFGGHNQAVGLTVSNKNFPKFKEVFIQDVEKHLPKTVDKKIYVDVQVKEEEINQKLCNEVSLLEPFGKGNEAPIFLWKKAAVADKKLLGKQGKHLKIWLKDNKGERLLEAIGFGLGESFEEIQPGNKIDVLFHIEENNWNGRKNLQLRLIDLDY
ncbi:MAG: single-stranded-DNA-specific exonuclease RecJ [Patescibacteria group bacterium]